ncbi:myeloid leukemia factor 2-like [Hypanus sabinus]|uniref:myeloid leukemia factor 2-like n=1 Tax=Hypanus sabinus TaxID=79690 RepID=UPI0028C3B887|nr:myeloid leukemia factor 2-like [Hypanus sabinus]
MDPFAAHRQHMSALFGGLGSPLGFDPFLSLTDGRTSLAPHPGALQHSRRGIQPGALSPFDMFGMGRVGFGDMFGMMNSMFSNMNSLLDNMVSLPCCPLRPRHPSLCTLGNSAPGSPGWGLPEREGSGCLC